MTLLDLELQWGRGFFSAESGGWSQSGFMILGFNGAADFSPRKGLWYRKSYQNKIPRFNGAADFSPRKEIYLDRYTLTTPPGFNGAADFSPRKEVASGAFSGRQTELQWGRGFFSAESEAQAGYRLLVQVLQWGRGFFSAESDMRREDSIILLNASMGPRIFLRGKCVLVCLRVLQH